MQRTIAANEEQRFFFILLPFQIKQAGSLYWLICLVYISSMFWQGDFINRSTNRTPK